VKRPNPDHRFPPTQLLCRLLAMVILAAVVDRPLAGLSQYTPPYQKLKKQISFTEKQKAKKQKAKKQKSKKQKAKTNLSLINCKQYLPLHQHVYNVFLSI
jgi:hypothetical protein